MTLADLRPGDRAVITRVDTGRSSVARIMVMGLVEGTEVEFVAASLGGDPLELRFYGSTVSVRRDDACCFAVERRPADG